jgi:hypothetical protein
MALIQNLDTLDYAFAGLPFVRWASPALTDTETLDYAWAGLPFYAQFDTQAVSACVVTIQANTVELVTGNRKFPNKRQEMVGETQVKQIVPALGAQYSVYLP